MSGSPVYPRAQCTSIYPGPSVRQMEGTRKISVEQTGLLCEDSTMESMINLSIYLSSATTYLPTYLSTYPPTYSGWFSTATQQPFIKIIKEAKQTMILS